MTENKAINRRKFLRSIGVGGALVALGSQLPIPKVYADPTPESIISGEFIQVPQISQTVRDSLSPANGMIIYNTTIGKFERYENGVWYGQTIREVNMFASSQAALDDLPS